MVMTMDYEQKYKEALERARKLYNSEETSADVEIACETIFPELAESEDEKIRKEIISHLQHEYVVKRYVSDVEYDRWLAWLENQPIISPEEMLDLLRMEYGKGRYDAITKAVEWLEDNFCEWPDEPKRVEGFFDTLEEMKEDFKKSMEQ